jgi:hypothetical protein
MKVAAVCLMDYETFEDVIADLPSKRKISNEMSMMKNHGTRCDPRWIIGPAALLSVALMSLPASAQGSPEQRAACEGDAARLSPPSVEIPL